MTVERIREEGIRFFDRHPNLVLSRGEYTEPQPDYEPFDLRDQHYAMHLSMRDGLPRTEHITLTNRMFSLREQWATNHPNANQYDMTGYEDENIKKTNPTMKKISKRSLSTTPKGDCEEPYILRNNQPNKAEGRGRSELPHPFGSHRYTLSSISSHESTMTPHSDQRSSRGRARTGTSGGRRPERNTNRGIKRTHRPDDEQPPKRRILPVPSINPRSQN